MDIIKSLDIYKTSGIIILLLTVVQITPIKINPWSFLLKIIKYFLKHLGTALNGDVTEKIDNMKTDIDNLNNKISTMEQVTSKISGMNDEFHEIKNNITNLNTKINDMEQVTSKISGMKEQLQEMKNDIVVVHKSIDEGNIIAARQRILRFGDEVMLGTPHSKGCFDQILNDIDNYNNYCAKNKEFKNHITGDSIKLIEQKHMEHLLNNDFLK